MAFKSFEDLEVWKRSCQLAVIVYEVLSECRDYGLKDQMQRSAVSIASNIAEGCERGGLDFDRFLRIALGSAAELRTQAYIADRVQIISSEQRQRLIADRKEISSMITGLRKSLKTEN